MADPAEATEYFVVMDLGDWLVIDATMDDELDLLSQQGWGEDDWGEPTRDPYWADLSELGHSVRRAGWEQIPDWPRDPEGVSQWSARCAGRPQRVKLTGRQWGFVVFALERAAALDVPAGIRAEYVEGLKRRRAKAHRAAATVRRGLAECGLEHVPIVRPRGR